MIYVCEKCGKEFEDWVAEDEFLSGVDSVGILSYEQFGRHLCGECAIEEFENGHYYETCERCGKQFNPSSEEFEFERQVSHRILGADMYEFGIYCADCAATEWLNSLEIEDDEDFDGERIDVYEAAQIWLSNGKDEDYMFGYTEEELEDALR